MSYCVNPSCPNPDNLVNTESCQACGTKLLLHDRYRAIQVLGRGGFGATFLAQNKSLPGEPYCVVKQLRPASEAPHVVQMARELFKREAKTLGKIGSHPQIPGLLDYFERDGIFYLVQEYISGITIQREVREFGPFSEAGVKQFLSEILPILHYVHSQQVIHRDIKPANVIRRAQTRQLVLIDFGAVKDQVHPTIASSSENTALTSYAVGTPGYAPPEQMAMRPVYASDIYALGVTCIYLLSGKSPKDLRYDPGSGEMLWEEHCQIGDDFAFVMRKMLEVSVRHRYQSATEVLRALDLLPYLDSLSQGLATQAATSPRTSRPWKKRVQPVPSVNQNQSQPNSNRPVGNHPVLRSRSPAISNHSNPNTGSLVSSPLEGAITGGMIGSGYVRDNPEANLKGGKRVSSPKLREEKLRKLSAADVYSYYTKGRRDFASTDLSGLDLQRLNLSGANFHGSHLYKASLRKSNLTGTDFGRASLRSANLVNANLQRAYLSHVDLEGADLRGADLSFAHLSNANLRGTNLCGANLTGARITDAQLALAKTNWSTIGPTGRWQLFDSKVKTI